MSKLNFLAHIKHKCSDEQTTARWHLSKNAKKKRIGESYLCEADNWKIQRGAEFGRCVGAQVGRGERPLALDAGLSRGLKPNYHQTLTLSASGFRI